MSFRVTHRIPTMLSGYLDIEMEHDSPEEAVFEHARLIDMYQNQANGVGITKGWPEIRRKMFEESKFDPNIWGDLDPFQQFFVNETKKTIRDLKRQTDEDD